MESKLPFDPIERAKEVEKLVLSGERRKYYRFRATGFYGGIATADAVGCSFLCAYCWNLGRHLEPQNCGHFYSPEEVVEILLSLSKPRGLNQVRISGAEPILGPKAVIHLIKILEIMEKKAPMMRFILETNGLLFGFDSTFAQEIAHFKNLIVRVSLKAVEAKKFEKITGAKGDFVIYPLRSLINLQTVGVRCWPAIMAEFFTKEEKERLSNFLKLNRIKMDIEEEELLLYPLVEANLNKRGFLND
ncbi:MAG: radical SAM protein [Candidatus Aminicenantes bacterium]|nr:radical SAM protein [Candidatus Aminicenantes bacterium]